MNNNDNNEYRLMAKIGDVVIIPFDIEKAITDSQTICLDGRFVSHLRLIEPKKEGVMPFLSGLIDGDIDFTKWKVDGTYGYRISYVDLFTVYEEIK